MIIILDLLWTLRMLICGPCTDALLMMITFENSDSSTVVATGTILERILGSFLRHGLGAADIAPR
jgi:hypothetical protein